MSQQCCVTNHPQSPRFKTRHIYFAHEPGLAIQVGLAGQFWPCCFPPRPGCGCLPDDLQQCWLGRLGDSAPPRVCHRPRHAPLAVQSCRWNYFTPLETWARSRHTVPSGYMLLGAADHMDSAPNKGWANRLSLVGRGTTAQGKGVGTGRSGDSLHPLVCPCVPAKRRLSHLYLSIQNTHSLSAVSTCHQLPHLQLNTATNV